MRGSAAKIIEYLEGADKRYIIPVYQRKYEWKQSNCRQLYNDLKKIINEKRKSYFLGSLVSSVIGSGALTEYHIIDGQQRITTITLLFLAIRNLINHGKITANDTQLGEQINQRFLVSPWTKDDDKIKLKPVKSDREALNKLFFADEEDYDNTSKLTLNYNFFCEQLLKQDVSPEKLYEAVCKLEIISITLDSDDNAQLIFESLNSTGLALTEGDKIRNYILMGQPPRKQTMLYETYWTAIMISSAKKIWEFPKTDFVPAKKQFASYSLDDEDTDFTGRYVIKYKFKRYEQSVTSWIDMFENIVKLLHQQDKSVLVELADNVEYVRSSSEKFMKALKIDENIYMERHTSTMLKLSILRKLFAEYNINPEDLEFYLSN